MTESPKTSTIRSLGSFEYGATLTNEFAPFNIVVIIRLNKLPSQSSMESAFKLLLEKHPLLSVFIDRKSKNWCFSSGKSTEIKIERRQQLHPDTGIDIVQEELNRLIDVDRSPLLRCLAVSAPKNSGELIFSAHHAIFDSASLTSFIKEFLELCVQPKTESTVTALQATCSSENYFPKTHRGFGFIRRLVPFVFSEMLDELGYQWGTRKSKKLPHHPTGSCRIGFRIWSEQETQSIAKMARKRGVSLCSLLNTCLLMAMHKVYHEQSKTVMRYISFQNLRPFLEPAVVDTHLGAHISMGRFSQNMVPNQNIWNLATKVQSQIYEFGKSGNKFIANSLTKSLMTMFLKKNKIRMSCTALSFTTHIPDLSPTCGDIKVEEVHGFVSNNVKGPYFTANGRISRRKKATQADQGGFLIFCSYLVLLLEDGAGEEDPVVDQVSAGAHHKQGAGAMHIGKRLAQRAGHRTLEQSGTQRHRHQNGPHPQRVADELAERTQQTLAG